MRVVFVVPYRFIPPENGGHKAAYGFASWVSKTCDFSVVTTSKNKGEAPFHWIPLFGEHPIKYVNILLGRMWWQFFRKTRPNWCITFQPFIALSLIPWLAIFGIKLMIYVQNIEFQRFRSINKWWWPILYAFEWIAYKKADILLFIAPTDLQIAVETFSLNPEKCLVIHYGTNLSQMPTDRPYAKDQLIQQLGLQKDTKILLFFGPQNYAPNADAVQWIFKELYPKLLATEGLKFDILICGGGMPKAMRSKFAGTPHFHYLGFVQDIDLHVKGADIMLNPIATGGGVKTKIIEAIALGTPVISFATGALGVDAPAAGQMLTQVEDHQLDSFTNAIVNLLNAYPAGTPDAFYQTYFMEKAVQPLRAIFNS